MYTFTRTKGKHIHTEQYVNLANAYRVAKEFNKAGWNIDCVTNTSTNIVVVGHTQFIKHEDK